MSMKRLRRVRECLARRSPSSIWSWISPRWAIDSYFIPYRRVKSFSQRPDCAPAASRPRLVRTHRLAGWFRPRDASARRLPQHRQKLRVVDFQPFQGVARFELIQQV